MKGCLGNFAQAARLHPTSTNLVAVLDLVRPAFYICGGGGFPCWWLTVVQAEGIPLSLLSLCTLIASDCACLTVLLVDALLIRVRFLKRIDAERMFTFCGRLAPEAHM